MDYVLLYRKVNVVKKKLSEFLTSSIQFLNAQCQSSIINIINNKSISLTIEYI